MKEVIIRTYTFEELSEKAQEKARDWYRTAMYEFGDYEDAAEAVIEDAKAIGEILGIQIDRVYYSVSYSQGDGACFEGTYQYQKGSVKEIKSYAPLDKNCTG